MFLRTGHVRVDECDGHRHSQDGQRFSHRPWKYSRLSGLEVGFGRESPANLQDHTYRAPTGYIFFDIFNQNSVQNPILRSVIIGPDDGDAERCLSFWFAPFGRGESSTLSVFRVAEVPPGTETDPTTPPMRSLLWRLSTRRMDTSRPDWRYAQVKVPVDSAFRIHFEGEATDGGFALDDITIYNGDCETRPPSAVIATTDV